MLLQAASGPSSSSPAASGKISFDLTELAYKILHHYGPTKKYSVKKIFPLTILEVVFVDAQGGGDTLVHEEVMEILKQRAPCCGCRYNRIKDGMVCSFYFSDPMVDKVCCMCGGRADGICPYGVPMCIECFGKLEDVRLADVESAAESAIATSLPPDAKENLWAAMWGTPLPSIEPVEEAVEASDVPNTTEELEQNSVGAVCFSMSGDSRQEELLKMYNISCRYNGPFRHWNVVPGYVYDIVYAHTNSAASQEQLAERPNNNPIVDGRTELEHYLDNHEMKGFYERRDEMGLALRILLAPSLEEPPAVAHAHADAPVAHADFDAYSDTDTEADADQCCWICGNADHLSYVCPDNCCWICGDRDHWSNRCPFNMTPYEKVLEALTDLWWFEDLCGEDLMSMYHAADLHDIAAERLRLLRRKAEELAS